MGSSWTSVQTILAAAALALMTASIARADEAPAAPSPPAGATSTTACAKADFEGVVEQAAGSLRDLNAKNKPSFQEKLRSLKTKRGWSNDQFMTEAAPFVRDDKIAEYDTATEDLLSAISSLGQEGAAAASPDCAVLLELRAQMKVLVDTQSSKWAYMFQKLDTELWK
jgi:hypothetical protein